MDDYEELTVLNLLRHCAERKNLAEGGAPSIFLSYAREDFIYVDLLRKNLEPSLVALARKGLALSIWEYADREAGTKPGGDFPTTIAENMWGCSAAIVFWSQDYVSSTFCNTIELPFLLWRLKHSSLKVFIVRINTTSIDHEPIALPPYQGVTGSIDLSNIADDRNPNLMPLGDANTELMLERLWRTDPGATKERTARYVKSICDLLLREFRQASMAEPDLPRPPASIRAEAAAIPASTATVLSAAKKSRRYGSRGALIGALVLVACIAVSAFLGRIGWGTLSGPDPSLALCDAAALSPSDPIARQGRAGIEIKALDPRHIPDCERAVAVSPGVSRYEFQLGRLYEKARRFSEAIAVYKRAADEGDIFAANNLGSLYRESPEIFQGRTDDFSCSSRAACDEAALTWFARADDGENALALYNMALMYQQRRGVGDRYDKLGCHSDADCDTRARDLFARAVSLGDLPSSVKLARLYLLWSTRVDKDTTQSSTLAPCAPRAECEAKAASVLRDAGDRGSADAQYLLGMMYEYHAGLLGASPPNGCATSADCLQQAVAWYTKAAPNSTEALERLKVLSAPKL